MNVADEARMTEEYLTVISLIGRLHRQFLEIVKLELDGADIRDINNVQAVMLFNLSDAEMTVGELTLRGCYLGSNVSYNLNSTLAIFNPLALLHRAWPVTRPQHYS